MSGYILAIDQGTTSSRAIIFDSERRPIASDQMEITQSFPKPGLVEHDAEEIWRTVVETVRNAIAKAGISATEIAGVGIANQRETVVIWDRETGKPVHPAIVWQDRRTADICRDLQSNGAGKLVTERTGLILDPYFSATKVSWILDAVSGARQKAEKGQLLFGTIDCFLLWKLTGAKVHATDATNASRTSLYDIGANQWDAELLSLFRVPSAMLPDVRDSSGHFGETESGIFGASIPILGMAGDQQAAMIGQGCFKPGMIKSTYGTGCFVVLNTGDRIVQSKNRMLSTIAYRLDGQTTYALEGSIFVAGAAVQWLRDSLGLIKHASETGQLAHDADEADSVVLVPAFAGMGAPHWDPRARAAIFGLTRGAGVRELARATLESVCFQTRDLLEAMAEDYDFDLSANGLRVDGGMSFSDWTMQALADCLGCQVQRSASVETTALGAAWLAGRQAGIWPDADGFSRFFRTNGHFEGVVADDQRHRRYGRWQAAVKATLAFSAAT